ncbi:sulfurtransferase [uncultured Dokdonia sp.]|uniref:sulfurtransferase n=1 Tax=uncultured Dokdonia sp. TaxID=575653 RepID=UPI0030EF174C|tara:strand:+ start:58423 stop:59223 length:801 start_codon:yes stop_codon:yes gene_type:complete
MVNQLVSVQWLKQHLSDENIVLLDASAHFNTSSNIRGAQHFDIKNNFSDTESAFPNTFPQPAQFEKECQALGIDTDSHIIVYDDKGIFTSPRVWWMFKTMGHHNVSVLDGGLPEWIGNNFLVTTIVQVKRTTGNFKAHLDESAIKSYTQVVQNTNSGDCQLIDARSSGRFNGTDPEPRIHIQSGHIKNSLNLPYTEVLDNGKFKSKKELKLTFDNLNLADTPIIFSCGSGITACIILFALALISDRELSVYDGSWTEWAEKQELFV